MNSLKVSIKLLRMLSFIAVFIWQQFNNYEKTGNIFSLESIGIGLGFGALLFAAISLFGFVLDAVRYYLFSIIITIAIILFCCFRLDAFIEAIPFLTEDIFMYILILFSVICMVRDVMIFKQMNSQAKSLNKNNGENSTSEQQ